MGTSYHTYLFIGCQIPEEAIFETIQTEGRWCVHFRPSGAVFCPECGMPKPPPIIRKVLRPEVIKKSGQNVLGLEDRLRDGSWDLGHGVTVQAFRMSTGEYTILAGQVLASLSDPRWESTEYSTRAVPVLLTEGLLRDVLLEAGLPSLQPFRLHRLVVAM